MGKLMKIIVGLNCAADVAGGIIVGSLVEKKTYEYTGNAVMATLAGSATGTAVGITALNATLSLTNGIESKKSLKDLEAENTNLKNQVAILAKDRDDYKSMLNTVTDENADPAIKNSIITGMKVVRECEKKVGKS